MANNYLPHVLVLPEDQANRNIVNGFVSRLSDKSARNIQSLGNAGGWGSVLDGLDKLIPGLRKFEGRHVILLMDFDGAFENRKERVFGAIPEDLRGRVFLLGARDEPETLKAALRRPFETIGKELADACSNGLDESLWQHEQLSHNRPELERLGLAVRPILFA